MCLTIFETDFYLQSCQACCLFESELAGPPKEMNYPPLV